MTPRDIYTYDLSDSIWNQNQYKYKCCGIEGYEDWYRTDFGRTPDECCVEYFKGCGSKNVPLYHRGCREAFIGVIEQIVWTIVSLTILTLILAFVNSIAALKLAPNPALPH